MKSYVGRGVGAHFSNELFLSKNYVYVVSRWISPSYAEKLVNLARNGVEVRVITSDDKEKNHQKALDILLSSLKPPRFASLRRKEWVPPNLELGIIREQYLHVKMYVFDDKLAVVGSANFTEHGLWQNIEHIVVFDSPEDVERIKNDFYTLWHLYTESKEAAKEVIRLTDIAAKLGKPLKELMKLLKK